MRSDARRTSTVRAGRDQRGFALLAVLLVLALVGVLGAEFAYSMRLEAAAVRGYKEAVIAAHLAEAGVAQAVREIVGDVAWAAVADDGLLTFYRRDRTRVARLPRERVPLGAGEFAYRLSDEEGRVNVNTAQADRLDRLLRTLGVEKSQRDVIVDSIEDWRDANEEHRLSGAESEDTYLKLPVPYRSRNGALESVAELLQIKGITAAIFGGAADTPGLAEVVTVKTPGQININTAPAVVLQALGLSEAEITEIVQARRDAPYTTVPARFSGRGLAATTRTYRIEAEGLVGGRSMARVTAIVQLRATTGTSAIVVLDWSATR
ncbi:MAG: general secretion pathway protein GspK [Candidatus Rokubacteria bacterium]|nr:general secretion pathway protein GspK [Candidatus Rokubacteria bacterium]